MFFSETVQEIYSLVSVFKNGKHPTAFPKGMKLPNITNNCI